MSDTVRWIIAISVIVVLLIIFVVSFILYQKTPVPKGCEDMVASEEKCAGCKEAEHCHLNIYAKKKASVKEETKEEKK